MPANGLHPLRVIDFGTVSPLRSQTCWHAVAHGVSEGSAPTLSFARPSDPYVCIGFHRRLAEVNTELCRERGWPVYRRMVGGGPVFLDSGQLFFQISVPMASVPASRPKAIRWLLEPAAAAFRASGIDAHVDDRLEIVVGDRKVCGYGAGQIGEAAIVVGNLIESFDHSAAASVLQSPTGDARAELERLIGRYVAATPTDPAKFRRAAVSEYSSMLGLAPQDGSLSDYEQRRLVQLDAQFEDPEWIIGPERPSPTAWQVKVRAGVWVFAATEGATSLTLGVDAGRVLSVTLTDPELNGYSNELAQSLIGSDLEQVANTFHEAGPPGDRLTQLLQLAQPTRL